MNALTESANGRDTAPAAASQKPVAKAIPGQPTWKDLNLTSVKELPESYYATPPELLPIASTEAGAIETLANVLGFKPEQQVLKMETLGSFGYKTANEVRIA